MWKVYVHTFPNGKRYIGICKGTTAKRWGKGGKGYDRHPLMRDAISEYGWETIKHEIVADGLTQKEAMALEERLIGEYKTFPPSLGFGYNCTSGGESRIPTDEQRKKTSETSKKWWKVPENRNAIIAKRTGQKRNYSEARRKEIGERLANINRGKHLSEEHKKKLSELRKGTTPWNTGVKMSEEYREKLSQLRKGRPIKHSDIQDMRIYETCRKPVMCVETGVIYGSQREASKLTNTNEGKISNVLSGLRKTAGGYHWIRVQKESAP